MVKNAPDPTGYEQISQNTPDPTGSVPISQNTPDPTGSVPISQNTPDPTGSVPISQHTPDPTSLTPAADKAKLDAAESTMVSSTTEIKVPPPLKIADGIENTTITQDGSPVPQDSRPVQQDPRPVQVIPMGAMDNAQAETAATSKEAVVSKDTPAKEAELKDESKSVASKDTVPESDKPMTHKQLKTAIKHINHEFKSDVKAEVKQADPEDRKDTRQDAKDDKKDIKDLEKDMKSAHKHHDEKRVIADLEKIRAIMQDHGVAETSANAGSLPTTGGQGKGVQKMGI